MRLVFPLFAALTAVAAEEVDVQALVRELAELRARVATLEAAAAAVDKNEASRRAAVLPLGGAISPTGPRRLSEANTTCCRWTDTGACGDAVTRVRRGEAQPWG